MYLDKYGLIVQADGDGGDSAQRTGFYYFGVLFAQECSANDCINDWVHFMACLKRLNTPEGFIRNPEKWNDPKDFSRDQHNPLVMAMGAYCGYFDSILGPILLSHLKRFGKYQNKDWAGPVDWGIYVRAFSAWYLYPYLLFSDLFLILGSMVNIVKSFDRTYTDDAPNWCMTLVQAKHFMPTPLSWIARKLYYNYRLTPPNPPSVERVTPIKLPYDAIKTALYYYFDPKFGGNIELAQLWEPIISLG